MNYTIEKHPNYTLMQVNHEKLDALLAPELKAYFNKMNGAKEASVILDLNGVKYIDSSGLTALLHGSRNCKHLVLVNPQNMVMKMLEIAQLNQILNISETVEAAIAYVQDHSN